MIRRNRFLFNFRPCEKTEGDAFGKDGMVEFILNGIMKDVCNANEWEFECVKKCEAIWVECNSEFFIYFAKDRFVGIFIGL